MARYSTMLSVFVTLLFLAVQESNCELSNCTESITTVSGPYAPKGKICSGDIVFEDYFDKLDLSKWQHENTMTGGGVSPNNNNLIIKNIFNN